MLALIAIQNNPQSQYAAAIFPRPASRYGRYASEGKLAFYVYFRWTIMETQSS